MTKLPKFIEFRAALARGEKHEFSSLTLAIDTIEGVTPGHDEIAGSAVLRLKNGDTVLTSHHYEALAAILNERDEYDGSLAYQPSFEPAILQLLQDIADEEEAEQAESFSFLDAEDDDLYDDLDDLDDGEDADGNSRGGAE